MPTTASGRRTLLNLNQGVGTMQALTGSGYGSAELPAGSDQGAGVMGPAAAARPTSTIPTASPAFYLAGLVLILVIMHVVGRHSRLGEVSDNYAGVNVWNFLSTGLMATVFILTLKLGVTKAFPSSTAANVVNFV